MAGGDFAWKGVGGTLMAGGDFAWKGVAEFDSAIDAWLHRTETASHDALVEATQVVHDQTASEFGQGNAPVSRSGALAAAVTMSQPRKIGESGLEVDIGPTGLVYIRRVEIGHQSPHSAGPHPFFAPGWMHSFDKVGHVIAKHWKSAQPKG